MSTVSPVLLILGAGSNVGASVAKGYKVALASRKAKEEDSSLNQLHIACDLSDPTSVPYIFAKIRKTLGVPSVVVYNAVAAPQADFQDPLSMPLAEFNLALKSNTTSVYAAAQEAAKGFAELPIEASKTFIYTGNIINTKVFGVGKAATAHVIEYFAMAYPFRGFKYRKLDGSPLYVGIDGEAYAKFYDELTEVIS
ncbi:uncharacterized protein N7443_001636 [Penicillium atrosanguineum]|uniref:uncharacterized protein n=1 Tax=Penicillium atrosanguineum TaxID=1132637 RepID=UPI00238EDB9E|nr:uncharacterized protein N7443_001636 [Penicillium atrosanguineum]KAJ5314752.1 hypothetical protein N7443_001636 [Penicillium atrosanguineum]